MGQQRSPINCSSSETTISKWYYARGEKKRVLLSLTLAIKCSGLEVTNTTATYNSLARNIPMCLPKCKKWEKYNPVVCLEEENQIWVNPRSLYHKESEIFSILIQTSQLRAFTRDREGLYNTS